jgi:hypothetical protein
MRGAGKAKAVATLCAQLLSVWLVREGATTLFGLGWQGKLAFWTVMLAAFLTVRRVTL